MSHRDISTKATVVTIRDFFIGIRNGLLNKAGKRRDSPFGGNQRALVFNH
jgi:hypothetical protein